MGFAEAGAGAGAGVTGLGAGAGVAGLTDTGADLPTDTDARPTDMALADTEARNRTRAIAITCVFFMIFFWHQPRESNSAQQDLESRSPNPWNIGWLESRLIICSGSRWGQTYLISSRRTIY